MQLEMEKLCSSATKDEASQKRLKEIEKEIADLKENQKRLAAQWGTRAERGRVAQKLQEEIEKVTAEVTRPSGSTT